MERAAEELWEAQRSKKTVEPLTERFPGITVEDAYAVQRVIHRRRLDAGRRVIGRKIGLTSAAMQAALGVHEPDFGILYDDMLLPEGTAVRIGDFIQPKIEAELAFVLRSDLKGPGVHFHDVLRATAGIIPAFEIIDSRVADWRIRIQDTVADNASSGALILGSRCVPVEGLDLRLVGLVLERGGEVLDTAAGAAVLGHPAHAVAWLCNKLAEFGEGLCAGDIVLSGSFTRAWEVQPGDVFRASFGGVGTVEVGFRA
ncbi:MAG: fumarylacetoacetate hydrolase family protein [Alicyclobacillaceae bacterium]|nr:fumarylacetoacetate hydrolase family protein [Alicyclobacillaceae bacterium]